jgi:CheY-like chemotaxis protein
MPGGVGGYDLAALVKASRPGAKIIYTSGYSADLAGRSLKLGPGERFLQKPVKPDELLNAVRDLLDGKVNASD